METTDTAHGPSSTANSGNGTPSQSKETMRVSARGSLSFFGQTKTKQPSMGDTTAANQTPTESNPQAQVVEGQGDLEQVRRWTLSYFTYEGKGTKPESERSTAIPNEYYEEVVPQASHNNIRYPPPTRLRPSERILARPGAFPVGGMGQDHREQDITNTNSGHEGLEMVEQRQPQQALQDSELAQAYTVSDPVSTAVPQENMKKSFFAGKRKWCLVLVSFVVGSAAIFASSSTIPFLFQKDPNRIEHQKMRKTIVDAFGESYFDNPQKEKALHWILHEDPRNALGIKEQGHRQSNLIQRFSLVAFYFQTSVQQPWASCNPPVGKQSDVCFYDDGANGRGRPNIIEGTRWLSATHECQWMGVVCDAGIAAELRLGSYNLTGSIPAVEIAMLTNLRKLNLWGNSLTGSLPKMLFTNNNLQVFSLEGNQLTEVGQFGGYNLWLFNNLLSGTIPQELGLATALKLLFINDNLLTGNLPPAIGALAQLQQFIAGGNPMEGSIPSDVGFLQALRAIDLSRSNVEGTIPEELYHCQGLGYLQLKETQVSGTISTRVGLLKNLWTLDISHTNIGGTIPEELAPLPLLHELFINGNNKLTGSIPEELCFNRNQHLKIAADCTPTLSTGAPAMPCAKGCCSTCCDAETKMCTEQ